MAIVLSIAELLGSEDIQEIIGNFSTDNDWKALVCSSPLLNVTLIVHAPWNPLFGALTLEPDHGR